MIFQKIPRFTFDFKHCKRYQVSIVFVLITKDVTNMICFKMTLKNARKQNNNKYSILLLFDIVIILTHFITSCLCDKYINDIIPHLEDFRLRDNFVTIFRILGFLGI